MIATLLAGLSTVWSRAWPYLAAAAGAVVAILTFGASQRRAGRADAESEIKTQTLEVMNAQRDAAARAPADRAALVERLRDGGF